MKSKCAWMAAGMIAIGLCGCANHKQGGAEAPGPGAVKGNLAQTQPAVRKTIEKELVGAELEDIAKKQWNGKTIYETDIIRGGKKWEVIVGESGEIIRKAQEGSAEERKADETEKAKESGWRETFNVNKADLQPTGNNKYLTIQPGKVLKLAAGKDRLTIT